VVGTRLLRFGPHSRVLLGGDRQPDVHVEAVLGDQFARRVPHFALGQQVVEALDARRSVVRGVVGAGRQELRQVVRKLEALVG